VAIIGKFGLIIDECFEINVECRDSPHIRATGDWEDLLWSLGSYELASKCESVIASYYGGLLY